MKKNLLFFLAINMACFSAIAQWSGDPAVGTKVCVAGESQLGSYLIADGSGGAIIFWHDSRNLSGFDIYYNKLEGAGNAVWAPVSAGLSLTNTTIYNYIDQVISDGSGGAFISWETDNELFVQHVNNAGAKTWLATGVSLSASAFGGNICSDGNGGIIITWSDYRGDLINFNPRSYIQRINSSGNKVWSDGGIELVNATGLSSPFAILADGSGGAIISFIDTRNSNYDPNEDIYDNIDIYAQRINASGNAVWAAAGVPVCTQMSNQASYADGQHPYIAPDGGGGAVICWEDYRNDANNGNNDPYNEDIFCQRINANGAVQWEANGVAICTASAPQTETTMMPDGSGGAVIVWKDERADFKIYTQKINGNGTVQWTANGLTVVSEADDFFYTASPDASNSSMLVSWNSNDNIKSQKINAADGALLWGSDGTLVCSQPDGQEDAAITHNGGSGAIISWTDHRNDATTSADIYANRVLANGTLPLTLITFDAQLIDKDVLLQWSTSFEENTSHFDIERSADGMSFTFIGNVNAAGNSSSERNYDFTDKDPFNGINFYRLKMVDADDKFVYSKAIAVKKEDNNPLHIGKLGNYFDFLNFLSDGCLHA